MTGWVYFDLDGTLVDTIPMARAVFEAFLGAHGTEATAADFDRLNGRTLDEIAAWVRDACRLTVDVAAVATDYEASLQSAYVEDARAAAGAEDLLAALRRIGRPAALVTAAPQTIVGPLLERLDWRRYFEVVVTGEDSPRSKPDPAPFLAAIERSGGDPATGTAVEDSANGVRAARAAGLRVIAVGSGAAAAALADAGATAVVSHLIAAGRELGLQ